MPLLDSEAPQSNGTGPLLPGRDQGLEMAYGLPGSWAQEPDGMKIVCARLLQSSPEPKISGGNAHMIRASSAKPTPTQKGTMLDCVGERQSSRGS